MNVEHLDRLAAKRKLWIECMSGNDYNSILNQIRRMVWNAAVFKVINEARKYFPRRTTGEPEANVMLHNFINRCFFDAQLLAIRRLSDKAYKIEHPKKGIFSLCALLSDMMDNACLMTRENLFATHDLQYDYEEIRRREQTYRHEKGATSGIMPVGLDSQEVKDYHEKLDVLSGVSADQRKPSDYIKPSVFDAIIRKIENDTKDVSVYVNKYLAHAATPESRQHDNVDEISITFGFLWNAHKVICQIANFIDRYLLTLTYHSSFLSFPQYDQFEFIENPLVMKSNVAGLRETWQQFQEECENWNTWDVANLERELLQYNGKPNT